jgi:hypothetical protein
MQRQLSRELGAVLLADQVPRQRRGTKKARSGRRSRPLLLRTQQPSTACTLPSFSALLAKRDRGRGTESTAAPTSYGATVVLERVEGAELLQAALTRGDTGADADDDSWGLSGSGSEDVEDNARSDEEEDNTGQEETEQQSEEGEEAEEEEEEEGRGGEETTTCSEWGADPYVEGASEAAPAAAAQAASGRDASGTVVGHSHAGARRLAPEAGSLADLKRRLAAAQAAKEEVACSAARDGGPELPEFDPSLPIEMQKFLTEDDFARIRWVWAPLVFKAGSGAQGGSENSRTAVACMTNATHPRNMVSIEGAPLRQLYPRTWKVRAGASIQATLLLCANTLSHPPLATTQTAQTARCHRGRHGARRAQVRVQGQSAPPGSGGTGGGRRGTSAGGRACSSKRAQRRSRCPGG